MAKTAKKAAAQKVDAPTTPVKNPAEVKPAPPLENTAVEQPKVEPDGITPVKKTEVHTAVKENHGGEHPDNGYAGDPSDGDALNKKIIPTFAEDLAPRKDEDDLSGDKKQEAIDHSIKNPNGIGNEWPR